MAWQRDWGQGPTPAVWNPYYGSWLLLQLRLPPPARGEARTAVAQSSTRDRAGCHLCDSFRLRLHVRVSWT